MKTFIAYRSTGEAPEQLELLLTAVRDALNAKAVEAYCTFFDEQMIKGKNLNKRQIIEHAFAEIDKVDFLFVLLASNQKSEGMLMEIGYCLAKDIPIIAAVKIGIANSHVPDVAERRLEWSDVNDLVMAIHKFDF